MARIGDIFGGLIGGAGAFGLILNALREREERRALQAAQLLSRQGTFAPVAPSEVPSTAAQRFFGTTPEGFYNLGGQPFQFQQFPIVPPELLENIAPGAAQAFGGAPVRLPQEDLLKLLVQSGQSAAVNQALAFALRPMSLPSLPAGQVEPPIAAPAAPVSRAPARPTAGAARPTKQATFSLLPPGLSPEGRSQFDQVVIAYEQHRNADQLSQDLAALGMAPAQVKTLGTAIVERVNAGQRYDAGLTAEGLAERGETVSAKKPTAQPSPLQVAIADLDQQLISIAQSIQALGNIRTDDARNAIISLQGRAMAVQNQRQHLIDKLTAPEQKVEEQKALLGGQLQKHAGEKAIDVGAQAQMADIMSDQDKLVTKQLGIKAQRYSELTVDEAARIRAEKNAFNVDQFAERMEAQSAAIESRQKASKRRDILIDLRKTEGVVEEVYQSWKTFTNPKATNADRARAALQMRKTIDAFGGTLARLVDKGVLTNQDREKAEGALPGIPTGLIAPSLGEQNFETVRRMLKTWRGIVDEVYGSPSKGSEQPAKSVDPLRQHLEQKRGRTK